MFPGYLFVRDAMDKDRYIDLLKVRGIVRVLEAGWSRLTPIPDEDIDAIQQIVQADVPVFPHAHLRHGDRVRVLEGPLAGLEGIFVHGQTVQGTARRLGEHARTKCRGRSGRRRRRGLFGRRDTDGTACDRSSPSSLPLNCSPHADARAQSEATLVPALSVSTVHDDNLFSAPSGVGDVLTYIRPSLEGRYHSPTMNLQSLISFDIQRSGGHSALNTLDARRHAMFDGRVRSTPSLLLGLAARYDRTETPGELNLDTGIMLDRQRARRVQLTPSVAYRVTPRTTITTQYDWTSEALSSAPAAAICMSARLGVARQWSPRTTWSARYLGRLFVDDAATHRSHAAMVGWTRRDDAGDEPVAAGRAPRQVVWRRHLGSVGCAHTPHAENALPDRLLAWRNDRAGDPGAGADSQRHDQDELGPAPAAWNSAPSRGVQEHHAGCETGDGVYHASLIGAWSREPYIVSFSYGSDLQQGDIRSRRSGEEQVRRGVFLVRLTVAPRLSRAFRPRG